MPDRLKYPVGGEPRGVLSAGIRSAALALAFWLACTHNPLYTANQNSYFLQGLSSTGSGYLSADWMANTVDPFPIFSSLVRFTGAILVPTAFHVFHALLLGVYVLAILGIACRMFGVKASGGRFLFCFLLLTILHSAALADISRALTDMNPVWIVEMGVAQQSIIGHELLPATFGVLLPLSIYAFLSRRPFAALLSLAIAVAFHSTYLLSAILLTLAYAFATGREGDTKQALLIVAGGIALFLPAMLFVYTTFGPTSPELFARSQAILARFRMPHHTDPAVWFNKQAVGVLIVIAAGLYLARKKTIFPILFIPFTAGLILTFVQILWPHDTLALLFPWRVSAWILPICWAIVVAASVDALSGKEKWRALLLRRGAGFRLVASLGVVLLAMYGLARMSGISGDRPASAERDAMMRFVAEHSAPGQMYLVPVEMEEFRLRTGIPILVDWKTHPYKDSEVIEWYERLHTAERFYGADSSSAPRLLREIGEGYGITHVVLPAASPAGGTHGLHEVYSSSGYAVFRLSKDTD